MIKYATVRVHIFYRKCARSSNTDLESETLPWGVPPGGGHQREEWEIH